MIYSPLLSGIPDLMHGFTMRGDGSLENIFILNQVHGDQWVDCDQLKSLPANQTLPGDAVLTQQAQQGIGVRTADCVPILLVSPEHHLIAAVHAGWKGTVAHIAAKVIRHWMTERDVQASQVYAVIGPCIHDCCFEVQDDVVTAFKENYDAADKLIRITPDHRTFIDLVSANKHDLLSAGVLPTQLETIDLCTHCRDDLFYSYRRNPGETGRQVAWLKWIK